MKGIEKNKNLYRDRKYKPNKISVAEKSKVIELDHQTSPNNDKMEKKI